MQPFSIVLRTQNVCPHCYAEKAGTFHRLVYLDGVKARCAKCDWDLGDHKELEIPAGAADVYRLLVARSAFEVSNFFDESLAAPSIGQVHLVNRASPNVQCSIDWQPEGADIKEAPKFKALTIDPIKLKGIPPIVASTVAPLVHLGATPIEASLDPDNGQLRFRLHNIINIERDGQTLDASLITRVQLWWRQ